MDRAEGIYKLAWGSPLALLVLGGFGFGLGLLTAALEESSACRVAFQGQKAARLTGPLAETCPELLLAMEEVFWVEPLEEVCLSRF